MITGGQPLDWRFAALWVVPWLLEFVFVHIAKPGYVLPLLPPVCVILAAFYARPRSMAAGRADLGARSPPTSLT